MAISVVATLAAWLVLDSRPSGGAVQDSATAAVLAANARGERAAAAVYDRQTGAYYAAGDPDAFYASASVVKVAIAGQLLATGQMGEVEGTAWDMIVRSDDSAASALYGRVGGDGVMQGFADRYGLGSLFAPPPVRGWWGITQITARGIVLLYAAMADDPVVGPWLMNAMANAQCEAADGYPQCFGIPAATSGWRIKQGWTAYDPGDGAGYIHSTGFVQGDRYTIALLTSGPGEIYGAYGNDTVTIMAQTLMPGGRLYDPADHNPRGPGGFDAAYSDGYAVTLSGWAYAPDNPDGQIDVHIYDGSVGVAALSTASYRPDVNAALGIGGNHGYSYTFTAAPGRHTYCAYGINQGEGTGNPIIACASVDVRPVVRDAYFVASAGATGSGMVEVHSVSRASGFGAWSRHYATALPLVQDPENWIFRLAPFQRDGRADLWAIHLANTGSGHVEVHILSEASGYQTWAAHIATPLSSLDPAQWQFDLGSIAGDGSSNLYAILTSSAGGSGRVEVHALTESSGFQTWAIHAATAFTPWPDPAQVTYLIGDGGGRGDLTAIVRYGTASGGAEAHAVSMDSGYAGWTMHAALPLGYASQETDRFALMDYDRDGIPDLIFGPTADTGSGQSELHVLSGASGFSGWLAHAATSIGVLDPDSTAYGVAA